MIRECREEVYCLGKSPEREEAVLELQSPWSVGNVALQVPRDCSPLVAEGWRVEQGVLWAKYSFGKSDVVEKRVRLVCRGEGASVKYVDVLVRVGRMDLSQSLSDLEVGGERTAAQLVERIREWVEERVEESMEAEDKGIEAWLEPGEDQDMHYFASAEKFAKQLSNVLQRHPRVSVRYEGRSEGGMGAREEWLRRLGESQAVYAAACAAASAACGALTGNPLAAATGATGCVLPALFAYWGHPEALGTVLYAAGGGLAGATAGTTARKIGNIKEKIREVCSKDSKIICIKDSFNGIIKSVRNIRSEASQLQEYLKARKIGACTILGAAAGLTTLLLYTGFPPDEYIKIEVTDNTVTITGGGQTLTLQGWGTK